MDLLMSGVACCCFYLFLIPTGYLLAHESYSQDMMCAGSDEAEPLVSWYITSRTLEEPHFIRSGRFRHLLGNHCWDFSGSQAHRGRINREVVSRGGVKT